MSNDTGTNTDDLPPSPPERADLLRAIKRHALDGYLRAGVGTKEGFEKTWREAFFADETAEAEPILKD